jgi:indole-3-glycerol phosphate synthase
MKTVSTRLQSILDDTQREVELDRSRYSLKRLKHMLSDAPPVISFSSALCSGNALIAEIKERSPSQGPMLLENFKDAPYAYKKSSLVKAISILTNRSHFGSKMRLEFMREIKEDVSKSVIRKDFIFDAYQVYQARAFGADAILLMANILEKDELAKLSELAFELGMDVLFETHRPEELDEIPMKAKIIGINSRLGFNGGLRSNFVVSKFLKQWVIGFEQDQSIDTNRFKYSGNIPDNIIKVAESGVTPRNCNEVFSLGFSAVLVGTSLLMDKRGVEVALHDFEIELKEHKNKVRPIRSLRPVPA